MSGIFISYRRADSLTITGRIYESLRKQFGNKVWRDINAIPVGGDFRTEIAYAISRCDIVIVVIGQTWATVNDANNVPRLFDPDDIVRLEVELALSQPKTRIIPVLVSGAKMPLPDSVPESIRGIVYKNAIQVRDDPDFHNDIRQFINAIKTLDNGPTRTQKLVVALLICCVPVALILFVALRPTTGSAPNIDPTQVVQSLPELKGWERLVGNGVSIWLPDNYSTGDLSFTDEGYKELLQRQGFDQEFIDLMMLKPPTFRMAASYPSDTSPMFSNSVIASSEYVLISNLQDYTNKFKMTLPTTSRVVDEIMVTRNDEQVSRLILEGPGVTQLVYIVRHANDYHAVVFTALSNEFDSTVEEFERAFNTFEVF